MKRHIIKIVHKILYYNTKQKWYIFNHKILDKITITSAAKLQKLEASSMIIERLVHGTSYSWHVSLLDQ
jgi:hypothetical protein